MPILHIMMGMVNLAWVGLRRFIDDEIEQKLHLEQIELLLDVEEAEVAYKD